MRFGPECGSCPDCGQRVGAKEGESTPHHQKPDGSRQACTGIGKPASA